MRATWLTLTDRRLRAAMKAVTLSGEALGDLAAAPGEAAAFFRPLRSGLEAAAGSGKEGSLAALSAAEDFTVRLEKAFSDMALLSAPPDDVARQALLYLQRACAIAPKLLSASGRPSAYDLLRAHCAGGRKVLRQALGASPSAGFPENLKFSSIYTGLDGAFEAFERCADALFRI